MNQRRTTREMTVMGLMVALLSASSYIIIPLPFSSASITAQTIVVNLIGLVLRPFHVLLVFAAWILAGLVGLPVFSGGMGGAAKLFGPTGGYIFGYLVAAVMISVFCRKVRNSRMQTLFLILAGIPIIYLMGAVWMKIVTGQPWLAIMIQAVLPFIPLDIVKCLAAAALAKALRPVIR
nr:biotin transporter BioY [uncultured Clostridium sp.]